jgi:SAM-dependent methyltransferase
MKNLLKRVLPSPVRRFLRAGIDKCSQLLPSHRLSNSIMNNPRLCAKFYPCQPDERFFIIPRPNVHDNATPSAELPIPPRELRLYGTTAEDYVAAGKTNTDTMRSILTKANSPIQGADRILDFGCGDGIMIRWLNDVAIEGEVWGVDINGPRIAWCQNNLSPPFHFVTTTTYPHLPFEDRFFHLIHAHSVFTHIADLADTWLLELRRILHPGGKLLVTIQDEHSIAIIRSPEASPHLSGLNELLKCAEKGAGFDSSTYGMLVINRTPGSGARGQVQVFYHTDYIRKQWGRYFKIVSITLEAYWFQTAILLER